MKLAFLENLKGDILKWKQGVLLIVSTLAVILSGLGWAARLIPARLYWLQSILPYIFTYFIILLFCLIVIRTKKSSSIVTSSKINKYEKKERKAAWIILAFTSMGIALIICFGLVKNLQSVKCPKGDNLSILFSNFETHENSGSLSQSLEAYLKKGLHNYRDSIDTCSLIPLNRYIKYTLPADSLTRYFKRNCAKKGLFVYGNFNKEDSTLNCYVDIYNMPLTISKPIGKVGNIFIIQTPERVHAQEQAKYVADYIIALLLQRLEKYELSNNTIWPLINNPLLKKEFRVQCCLLTIYNYLKQGQSNNAISMYGIANTLTDSVNNFIPELDRLSFLGKRLFTDSITGTFHLTTKGLSIGPFAEREFYLTKVSIDFQSYFQEELHHPEKFGQISLSIIDSTSKDLLSYHFILGYLRSQQNIFPVHFPLSKNCRISVSISLNSNFKHLFNTNIPDYKEQQFKIIYGISGKSGSYCELSTPYTKVKEIFETPDKKINYRISLIRASSGKDP